MDLIDYNWLAPFIQVVLIDLTLAGDNAVVIGLAAAGLPAKQRGRAILIGILAATAMRIGFSVVATQLLQIVGLLLAGGILLLWVSWKMWRELRRPSHVEIGAETLKAQRKGEEFDAHVKQKTLSQAVVQIVVADISMSLDNVLAVAGAAREHISILVFGLGLSVVLMGLAATLIARLLEKHRWVAYVGLAIILFVAVDMIVHGAGEVLEAPAVEQAIESGLESLSLR
jgi:YjbE family integral membrane protein